MSKQITKKQHYVPKYYLKYFSTSGSLQVLDILHGKIKKPRTYGSVCYAPFYYAMETGEADEASQEFETYFKAIEDMFAVEYASTVENVLSDKHIAEDMLYKLSWFVACLWARTPKMRNIVNDSMEDGLKQYASIVASNPNFSTESLLALRGARIEASPKDTEKVQDMFRSGNYKLNLNNHFHLNLITKTEIFQRWFYAKNWKFYIVGGEASFITSDTPVIDLYRQATFENHIMMRRQYFPLTPKILIELIDPRKSVRTEYMVVDDFIVEQYNLLRVRSSQEHCYGQQRKDLESLQKYYQRLI